eukprot:1159813-Pelagomonas_calceolata.AAC.1
MAHPAVDQVSRFLREEFVLNENKRKANMVLLRSLGVFFGELLQQPSQYNHCLGGAHPCVSLSFAGSVYVFRSFGEALFAV